jgi:NitT/TauT family transport system ATP-binding protein
MAIEIRGVSKLFVRRGREVVALDDFSLSIGSGEFVAFVGPSGCGKSTLLNMIAGILEPTGGVIEHDGKVVQGPNRSVGYMTQADSLLPWRTAEDNVMLPLRLRGVSQSEARERAAALLATVNLSGFHKHFPNELSGGMRKRVALAQVLAYDPGTLLMDEPFGALDAFTRDEMNLLIQEIWMETRKTITFVTHSIAEAIFLADRVAVMSARPGRIAEIYDIDIPRPRSIEIQTEPDFIKRVLEIKSRIEHGRGGASPRVAIT